MAVVDAATEKRPRTRAQYEADIMREAREWFAGHHIRSRSEDGCRWTLQARKGDGWAHNLWCEVVVLDRHSLLVRGDVDFVVWGGFSGGDPREVVAWLGDHGDLQYVGEKATIGFDSSLLTEERNGEVLRANLQDYLDRGTDLEDEVREAIGEALERLSEGDPAEACERIVIDLLEADALDAEDCAWLGYVTTRRVIVGHAAVARLWELLCAEGGA